MERVLTVNGARPDIQLGEDELRAVPQPVLLLWGSEDPFGSLDVARRVQKILPQAVLHNTGIGHLPWWDDAEICARLIKGFLIKRVDSAEKAGVVAESA
jgi:pimeloyl-ACP methyl ester carboxylesterase